MVNNIDVMYSMEMVFFFFFPRSLVLWEMNGSRLETEEQKRKILAFLSLGGCL